MECVNTFTEEARNIKVPDIDTEPHLLISSVRNSYLKYMTRMLHENYVSWCGEKPPHAIVHAAEHMELCAAAKAMLVPLYRTTILTMIDTVKKHTASNNLIPEIQEFCINSKWKTKSTQTEPERPKTFHPTRPNKYKTPITSSLDIRLEKLRQESKPETHVAFENKKNLSEKSEHSLSAFSNQITPNSKISFSSDDDNVMMEMEKLFQEDCAEGTDDIFNTFMGDKQIKMIMDEINQYNSTSECTNLVKDRLVPESLSSTTNGSFVSENEKVKMEKDVACAVVSSTQKSINGKKYHYTPWPCELYYQKQKLRIKLDLICEKSFKLHAKIKDRFIDLFGYDSDDEQALQSPDNSEDFLRSCRQRSAPHVAKHLRPYVQKARVPAHLFKPLARHLLHMLVKINQYPDDYGCYLFVKDYFHHRPRIRCQADF